MLDVEESERPAKRQKLDDNTSDAHVDEDAPDYVCLATRVFRIHTDDVDVYKTICGLPSRVEAEIKDVHTALDISRIRLKISSLNIIEAFEIVDARTDDIDLLTRCSTLPSTLKKRKTDSGLSVARYRLFLSSEASNFVLHLSVSWYNSVFARSKTEPYLRDLFRRLVPSQASDCVAEALPWDVKEFYENVHVPKTANVDSLQLDAIQCKLYPFQERATRWLLAREGVIATSSGQLISRAQNGVSKLPFDFVEHVDAFNRPCYISHSLHIATYSREVVEEIYGQVRGGILAEAMGLGKTVEMIALMCTHRKEKSPVQDENSAGLLETGATLIITPPTILEQWKQELRDHAPNLRVYHYTGTKTASKSKIDQLGILVGQDVVLTTYSVIASEIHYVKERPDRHLRARPRRLPPKSPLTQILWWRCLLDEAQMIESGVSNAAVVARLIPRVNAWAVTGTPLKQSHRDLYGLLLFLRFEPWSQSFGVWDHLVSFHRPLFRQLVRTIVLRHSKEIVREELRIPPQARRTVTMPFSAVEESHYAQMHFDMHQDIGLDACGAPLDGAWDPNNPITIERMRSWLKRLRQTCLHPEVGGKNRMALGKRDNGPLRTVAQVLDVMIDQADSNIHMERRSMLIAKLDRGRLYEHARVSQIAHDIFQEVSTDVNVFVEACRAGVTAELSKVKARVTIGKAVEEESEATLTLAKTRLRSALEVKHICYFFLGNTYFQLKEKIQIDPPILQAQKDQMVSQNLDKNIAVPLHPLRESNTLVQPCVMEDRSEVKTKLVELEGLETDAYEKAKSIRSELLTEVHQKALRRITTIRAKREMAEFVSLPTLQYTPDDFGGIESRKVFEKLYHYCQAMNTQAVQFVELRSRMTEMLSRTLIDEDDSAELTGGEYEDSTIHQDEMYVYMELLRALFADRNDAMTGQENLLLKQESKQWSRAAREGAGPAPGLMLRLLAEREAKRIDTAQQGSMRGIMTEIRSLVSTLEWQGVSNARAKAELVIVNNLLKHVQQLQAEQTKCISALEQEVSLMLDTMNSRLDYFRALQVISDMVAPIGEDEDVGKAVALSRINQQLELESAAAKKLMNSESKRRYLSHLKSEQASEGMVKICTICQFEFEMGTLTVCGHQFCKECINMWWSEHRNCPVCKRKLHLKDFYDVALKPSLTTPAPEETSLDASASQKLSQSNSIYATIASSTMRKIQAIDLRGSSYGSKVDTLVRHVLYLRQSDPGSKSVIFSQYRDFLDVLSRCLRDNTIIHSKFDDKDGISDFKSNPANECFLLHAKAHSAGLNLVCASHVILCEPLINTAIELQAVARVHRIGQVRETCVWMYLIEGTVEEAIYDISVERRLAHMDRQNQDGSEIGSRTSSPVRNEGAIEAADAKELQAVDMSKMFAAGKTGGEMVDQKDLWSCLFGNARKREGLQLPRRGISDLRMHANVEAAGAGSTVGIFIRAQAAQDRANA